jgi:hypothetical protein
MGKKNIDLTGQRFGRLTAEVKLSKNERRQWIWRFRCDCGSVLETYAQRVLSGGTKSCGCIQKEIAGASLRTHGKSLSKEHACWKHIIQRCTNPKNGQWKNYGGRGIEICSRWRDSFEAFLEDMGYAPEKGFKIERVDNSKGYEPGNCEWKLMKPNVRNRRITVKVMYEGKERILGELCETEGVPYMPVYQRIFIYGASPEDAVSAAHDGRRWDHKGRMHVETIDGQTGSLSWLARRLGLVYQTLYHHVVRSGLTAQEAADFMRSKLQSK